MPSKSKAQQRFMGMVHAVQAGKLKAPSKEIAEAARSINKQDAKDFASTKLVGLPEHVKKAISELSKGIEEEKEHSPSRKVQTQIAKDHLKENPKYYSILEKCMKKAECTNHDPNIPKSFDSRQKPIQVKGAKKTEQQKVAYVNGFVKAAMAAGYTEGQAIDIFQKSH